MKKILCIVLSLLFILGSISIIYANNDNTENTEDKKIINSFYFYEENYEYKSPIDGINILFYLNLPENISIKDFWFPTYAEGFINNNTTVEKIKIESWEVVDITFKDLPDNSIVFKAIFPDNYILSDECDNLYGILIPYLKTRGDTKTGDNRVYRGESEKVESDLFKWKKNWTYTGTSSYQVSLTFKKGDKVSVNKHYFKDASGNKITDIYAYCLEQRWPGPSTSSTTESNYGVIKEVKTLDAVYGTANANKLRAILDHGYPVTRKINGVTWSAEEARQITQMAIRRFLADIGQEAAYPAFSSSNINTYIEDTKNGTAMDAITYLLEKANSTERFTPLLELASTNITLIKSGNNYIGEVKITTNLDISSISIDSNTLTSIGGSITFSNQKLYISVPEDKINNINSASVTLKYHNPKKMVDSNAYFYEPTRRLQKSTRQALLGLTVSQTSDTKQLTFNIEPEVLNGSLYVIKESATPELLDKYPLDGAKFTVYMDEECTQIAKDIDGSNAVLTVPDGSTDGKTNIINMDFGTYYIKETKAPAGYKLNNEVISITVSENNNPVYITFINEVQTSKIFIKKMIDGTTTYEPIGCKFTIYTDEECTQVAKDINGNDAILEIVRKEEDQDYWVSNAVELYIGNYYVKETYAPDPFIFDSELTQDFEIKDNKIISRTFTNDIQSGDCTIIKTVTQYDLIDKFPIVGTTFTIYTSEETANTAYNNIKNGLDAGTEGIVKDKDGNNAILVVNKVGNQYKTNTVTLLPGNYWIVETVVMPHYKMIEVQSFTLENKENKVLEFENELQVGEGKVKKIW